MKHFGPFPSWIIPSTLLALSVFGIVQQDGQLRASTVFFPNTQSEQGIVLKSGDDNIVFCLSSTVAASFVLMTPELLGDTTADFTIYEYTGHEPQETGKMYASHNPTVPNTLTEFKKGKMYLIRIKTPATLTFKCGVGLGKQTSQPTSQQSVPSSAPASSSQASIRTCPSLRCVQPNPGCHVEPATDENGCPTCGIIVCNQTSQASSAAASTETQASSAQTDPNTVTDFQQNAELSLEISTAKVVRVPGRIEIQIVVHNKTNTSISDATLTYPLPFAEQEYVSSGAGCTANNVSHMMTCDVPIMQPGSWFGYRLSLQSQLQQSDCNVTPRYNVIAKRLSSPNTLSANIQWQWDCSTQTTTNNYVEITQQLPATIGPNVPLTWQVKLKNKTNGGIPVLLTMDIPEGAELVALPGCGQAGTLMTCWGETLAGNAEATTTFGTLKFGAEFCGKTVDLGTMRDVAVVGAGQIFVQGESAPMSIFVDCSSPSSASSIRSSQASSEAFALAAVIDGPTDVPQFSNATYTLSLFNGGTTTVNNVSFTLPFPKGMRGNGQVNSPSCRVDQASIICNNLSIPAGLTLPLSLQMTTDSTLPCSDFPLQVTVNAGTRSTQTNTLTIHGCSYPDGASLLPILNVPGGFIPKNTTQTLRVMVVGNRAFAGGALHVILPEGTAITEIKNYNTVGNCTFDGNIANCTGIDLGVNRGAIYDIPFTVSENVTCGQTTNTIALTYNDRGEIKQLVKTPKVFLCDPPPPQPNVPVDAFSISAELGECLTEDCRTFTVHATLHNTGPIWATNAMISAKMSTAWSSVTENGWTCQGITPNGSRDRTFLCPGSYYYAVAPQSERQYTLIMSTTSSCSEAKQLRDILLQSAPSSIYEQNYSNNSVTIPMPNICPNGESSASSAGSTTPGLAITATLPTTATIGDNVHLSLTATNTGNKDLEDVVIYDQLPADLWNLGRLTVKPSSTVNNSSNNVICTDQLGTTIRCTVVRFPKGGSLTIDVELQVATIDNQPSTTPYCPSTIRNTATASNVIDENTTITATSPATEMRVSCPVMSFTTNVTATPAPSGTPSAVHLHIGDTVIFDYTTQESGVINNAFAWNWNSAVLHCTSEGEFDSNAIRCVAYSSGESPVSVTMYPVMADGTQRTVQSNIINTSVTGESNSPEDENQLSMRFTRAGELGPHCTGPDCRTVIVPFAFINRGSSEARDVQLMAAAGAMWDTMSVKGIACSRISSSSVDQHRFTCPGLTVPSDPDGTEITEIVLTSNAPCPMSNVLSFYLGFTGTWATSQNSSTEISTTLPLPNCTISSAGSSSGPVDSVADVKLQVTGPQKAERGSTVQYNIVLTNNGPDSTFVHVLNEIAPGLNFNPDMSDENCTIAEGFNPPRFVCDFGNPFHPGDILTSTVGFTIATNAQCPSIISQLFTAFTSDNDPLASNNVQRGVTAVTCSNQSSSIAPPKCGNGKVEGMEMCDDGNKIDTDSCKNNCQINFHPQTCGNGIPEGTEQCDDGNDSDEDACSTKCTILEYTPPPVSIENIQTRIDKDPFGPNMWLYISGEIVGRTNVDTQRILLSFAAPYSYMNAAADSGPTFYFRVPIGYNKTYVPTIQVTERVSVYKTVVLGQKQLDPVMQQPPTPLFSTAEHYGMFVTNYPINGNFKLADPAIAGAFVTGWKAADLYCNMSAQEAGLSATGSSVWHSTISNPHRQIFPLYNMKNELLAAKEEDLWSLQRGALPAKITNAFGVPVYGNAWTGSDGTGRVGTENCKGWTTNLMPNRGSVGTINGGGGGWYQSAIQYCQQDAYLYCVNDLTQ